MIENALPDDPTPRPLKTTPLDAWHRSLGARMVPFAGYAMPVQYQGVLAEHLHCRAEAALFDVSHMGQATLTGAAAAAALERLVPGDLLGLKPGRQRYTLLTNEAGGIIDDLMVANIGEDRLFLVVNASRKDDRLHPHRRQPAVAASRLHPHEDRALLALQGPAAAAVMRRLCAGGRHDCRSWASPPSRWPASRAWSRAPATPARTGSRYRSPPTAAEELARAACWRSPRWRPRASARAIRCGWRPGSASTATTSTN